MSRSLSKEAPPQIARREFLRLMARLGLGFGTILLFGGCATKEQPKSPPPSKTPRSTLPEREGEGELPPLTEKEIKDIAAIAVGDSNKVLGLNLSKEEVLNKVVLVKTLEEYQEIIKTEEEGYMPQDELGRPGISTTERNPLGKKIFLYKQSLEEMTRLLPANEEGKQARADFIEWVITHELAHWTGACYESDQLHDIVYGRMLENLLKGKDVQKGYVKGAEIKATIDGVRKSIFENLEEAEAFVVGNWVMLRRGRPQIVSYIHAEDLGIRVQRDLLHNLLMRLDPNLNQSIQTLARLRCEPQGREKLCVLLGERFKIPAEDQLFFGLSVLYAIDIGDSDLYQRYCGE